MSKINAGKLKFYRNLNLDKEDKKLIALYASLVEDLKNESEITQKPQNVFKK